MTKLSVLDICPTLDMFERTDMAFATAYYHWFFLIQPFDYPERMIGADPGYYLNRKMRLAANASAFPDDVVVEYVRHFSDPATVHATCEDYRAAASIDLEHDRVDRHRPLSIPIQALWGAEGVVARSYDVLSIWRGYTTGAVTGQALPCGHFLPEEAPEDTLTHLLPFLEE